MPLTHSTNIVITPADFTSSSPVGGVTLAQSLGINNVSNIKWANKTRQLNLGNTNYGYATFDISYTITGTTDVIGVSFYSESTILTYSTTLSGLFKPVFNGEYIKLTPGVTTRLYVIVNALTKDSTLPINFIIGKKGTPPSNITINLQYNCNDVGPLYKYLMGLHAYSAYDALNSPALQTYLYSYTPIGSWTTDTEVYSAANFSHPAYPYYYGYNGNVYKVGGELERSFGTKYYFECIKWWAFGDTKTYTKTIGPKAWLNRDDGVLATDNFVFPEMPAVGKLKKIIPSANIVQPSSYRYYMGVAPTQQASADYFTQFDFQNRTSHTVAGSTHAMSKLSQGFTNGFKGFVKFDYEPWGWLVWLGASIAQNSVWTSTNTTNATTLLQKIGNIWAKADGFYTRTMVEGTKTISFKGFFTGGALPGGIPIVVVVIIIIIIILIVKLFKPTKAVFEEPPIKFRYRYANTPYLNNGTRLFKNTTLSTYSSEYYCDGIYFYNQTGGTIANKELSYSTNALIQNDPIKKGLAYSLKADQPDSGSVLSDFTKLAILPYCSGKPDTVSSTNINTTQTATFTPLNKGGDLLTYPLTVTVEIPEGTIITTGSQALANAEAKNLLNELTSSYAASGSYGQTISGIDGFGAFFTHEIKVETYPNTGSVFFNNNDGNGLTVGKSLYYDNAGYLKVSNGYYAATTESYASASYHRTFYKTVNGSVTDILSMASSVATTVTSLVNSATYPVQTSNQNHTSDWYWYDISYNDLKDDLTPILESKPNPNSLYTTSSLKAGFCTPDTSSFYTYNSIPSTASYSEATPGFYYAFSSYENPYIFTYSTPVTLSINLTEVCFTDYSIGEPYGINISGASGSSSSSLYYPVYMTLNAYNGGSLITSFPATASAEGITYVDFPAPITKDSNVTNVTVASISSPNPNNKILYVGGSFTNCNPTTPAPTAAPTAAPTTAAPTTAAPTTAAPTTAAPTAAPTTAAPTTAAPTTPAPTTPPCECWTIYNEGNTTGNYTIINCNGTEQTINLTTVTRSRTHCIKGGTFPIINSGLLTEYECGTTCNVSGDCTYCGPTPAPTTAAPTAAPTTAAPTAAPTTAAPTTPSPTAQPTPAPTAPFAGNIEYSTISAAYVCDNGSTPLSVTGNGSTFCTSTTLTGAGWVGLGQNTYYIKWIGSTDYMQVYKANSSHDYVTRISGGCNACPTPAPTAAPTTAAPTTAAPTAAPTTAAPTTPAPTPAAPPYSFLVNSVGRTSSTIACSIAKTRTLYAYESNFMDINRFYSTNTYPFTIFDGNSRWYSDGVYSQMISTLGYPMETIECPTPSPTAAPTTAAPTTAAPTAAPTTPAPTCPAADQLLSEGCINPGTGGSCTYRRTYTNGACGSYNVDTSECATCCPADGTLISNDSCVDYGNTCSRNRTVTNGSCGTRGTTYSDCATCCPAAGTIFSEGCIDPGTGGSCTYRYVKADGSCGTYNEDISACATCCPAADTIVSQFCLGSTLRTIYTNGTCGTYTVNTPNSPSCISYFYYEVTPCFGGANVIARSTDDGLSGVYAANSTCYTIQDSVISQAYSFDIDPANYQGGSCLVSGCGYSPPPIAPPPTASTYSCDYYSGCYADVSGPYETLQDCNMNCIQP